MSTQMSTMPALIWSSISIVFRKCSATERSACSGHAVNQSIVQQLTSAGNMRSRRRNASPIGERQSTTCRFVRQRETKNLYISPRLPVLTPCAFAAREIES